MTYVYQISPRLLGIGTVCLSLALGVLGSAFLGGLPSSVLWWVATVLVVVLLALTSYMLWVTRRNGPFAVTLQESHMVLPAGALGTGTKQLDYTAITGLRAIGRASMFGSGRVREVFYLIDASRYAVLMSELFEDYAQYRACRDAIITRVRVENPDVPIDVDGVPLAQADLPQV